MILTLLSVKMPFEQDFLEELIRDGRRHVKFDFKVQLLGALQHSISWRCRISPQDLEAVRRCLPLLAERSGELAANGQVEWDRDDELVRGLKSI